ncbi:uncharacterized protein LOC103573697 [Microplitis demolitor]|uniref:uncharacterized protein LOC103573697 n=1 Tax=Microplitis demolitor TaxID=69319 RepID=UPI00235B5E98|nr:uncharacterized protein LOC103573697 [Microplitis demolitor]
MMTCLVVIILVVITVTAAPLKVKLSDDIVVNNDIKHDDEESNSLIKKINDSNKEDKNNLSTLKSKKDNFNEKSSYYQKYSYMIPENKYLSSLYDAKEKLIYNKKIKDSNIFYVRLPPVPYFYVPGLGYISNPPKFSTSNLRPGYSNKLPSFIAQNHHHKKINPFINLPIDFISNGKPMSVYQWENPFKNKKKQSSIKKLKKGPYGFNGKPTSIYLIGPDAQTSFYHHIYQ